MTNHFPKRFLLALLLLTAAPAWATISSQMIFEVRSAGSNSNGGCFKEGAAGTDFSQQSSAQFNFTDLVIDATTNTIVTSASHNFVTADVGNCVRATAGTGFTTGIYEIVSVASNAATMDRAVGTTSSTGGTWFEGGAIATLAQLNTDMCNGCRAYVKADGTYSVSANIQWNYSNSGVTWIAGYSSSRGDNGRAVVQASTTFGDYIFTTNMGSNFTVRNFTLDANSESSVQCLRLFAQQNQAENIECKNWSSTNPVIWLANVRNVCRFCWAHDGNSAGGSTFQFSNLGDLCFGCTAQTVSGNSATAYTISEGTCLYCAVDTLSGTTSDAFSMNDSGPTWLDHVVVYNISRDTFKITAVTNTRITIQNAIVQTAATVIDNTSGTTLRDGDLFNDYNFAFNISGTAYTNVTAGAHSVTLTKAPFINASSHDFRLNNTKGGGSSVRAGGSPGGIMGLSGSYFPDAGIAQHQDPKFQ